MQLEHARRRNGNKGRRHCEKNGNVEVDVKRACVGAMLDVGQVMSNSKARGLLPFTSTKALDSSLPALFSATQV